MKTSKKTRDAMVAKATELIDKTGLSNAEIINVLKEEFKDALAPQKLGAIRRKLRTQSVVLAPEDPGTNTKLKSLLDRVAKQMKKETITRLILDLTHDGSLEVTSIRTLQESFKL